MNISFKWEGDLPTYVARETVEDSILALLEHAPDPRGLIPKVAIIYLSQDAVRHNVKGVGYSRDDQQLITVGYRLLEPRMPSYEYYENPQQT